MISVLEALRYRCLRYVRQPVSRFQMLVGGNASGKSTFLDVPVLLQELLREGPAKAIQKTRAPDVRDLVWMRAADSFEMAVELSIPPGPRAKLRNGHDVARYEVALGFDAGGELCVLQEALALRPQDSQGETAPKTAQLELFPDPPAPPESIFVARKKSTGPVRTVVTNARDAANAYFAAETSAWRHPFRIGSQKLALANLPEDEDKFPVAVWVKRTLMEGIHHLVLDSQAMRAPAPPGTPKDFQADGSNLPWVADALQRSDPEAFGEWIRHVRTALPDIESVESVEREEDRHRYLRVRYRTGLAAPSWTVSDGTLRFLALTLLAYVDPPGKIFLIEEPENGIHPQALEAVFQALSSVRQCQVLCATHSPVLLSLAEPSQVLCFSRAEDGATDVVAGSQHPRLATWRKGVEADLGLLFAAGVLG